MSEKYSISEHLSRVEKDLSLGSSNRFKFEEGENRFRVLTPFEAFRSSYQGQKPRVQFAMYVLDRKDATVKMAYFPYAIIKAIQALEKNQDYAFAEMPMPYDLTVVAKGAGTKEVEYNVVPSPKLVPLSQAELGELEKQRPLKDVIEELKQQQLQEQNAQGAEIDASEIPR